MGLWRLILRLTVGLLFVGHGTQKLFGWFGGDGIAGTGETMDKVGLHPGRETALAAGIAEAGSGVLLAAGAAMPLAAAGITATMLTATKRVHLPNGIWAQNGGFEYPAVLIGTVLALVERGAGKLSFDALTGRERSGAGWAAMAFGAGSLAAFAVEKVTERDLGSPIAWIDEHRPHLPERIAA